MNLSADADAVLHEIRELRAARRERLERDLHFIDAEYDRLFRRINAGVPTAVLMHGPRLAKQSCVSRRCRRGMRNLRRSLKKR